MCGIVGYVGQGQRDAVDVLMEGLHRLEYRGYDSAGIAAHVNGEIVVRKRVGRVAELTRLLTEQPVNATLGIGHTRWATHGGISDVNSHPHLGGNGEVVVVHNGVIENYAVLRERLQELGYTFQSSTDTEVIAHSIAHHLGEQVLLGQDPADRKTVLSAVQLALKSLKGTFGLGILFRDHPELLIAARLGSPLVVGIGKNEYYLASDASPLVGYTDEVVYLSDHELVLLSPQGIELIHRDHGPTSP